MKTEVNKLTRPFLSALLFALWSTTAHGLERSLFWDGSDNGLWADQDNWALGRPPTSGDSLTFPASGFWKTTVNNYTAGTTFDRISYSGAGYMVSGNRVGLTDGLIATHTSGVTTFGPDVGLAANIFFTAQNAGTTLDLGGLVTLSNFYTATFAGAGLVQVSNAVRRVANFAGGLAIIKDGTGTTLLTKSNELRGGAVWVRAGTLTLAHNFALGGAGMTTVSNGATLALDGNLRLDSGGITLAGTLRSELGANVVSDTITLSGNNAAFDVPGSLTVSGLVAGATGFTVLGGSTLRLVANNSYSGPTVLNVSALIVDGLQPSSPIVLNGGILSGNGYVGVISSLAGGIIDIGSPVHTQSCSGLALNTAATMDFFLSSAANGTPRNSQLVVNGPVDLGGCALDFRLIADNDSPIAGDSFLILRNDDTDPVTGTFAGLPEGAVTSYGQFRFQITYAGGDGNDVVLIALPSQKVWDGGSGTTANWNDANNWDSGYFPRTGDDLFFPAGVARLNNTNNLGLNTRFRFITLSGTAYTLGGNQILLRGGISQEGAFSSNRIALPIRLDTNVTIFTTNSSTLVLLTNVDTLGKELTLASEGDLRISGVVSGAGSLVKSGSGVALLTGSNTYSGTTELLAGTLQVARSNALGTVAGGTRVGVGAILSLNSGLAVAEPFTLLGTLRHNSSGSGTGLITGPTMLQGAEAVIEVEGAALHVNGLISGTGSFTKRGAGPLFLNAANTYSGATVLAEGALFINGSQPQSPVLLNGGTLGGTGVVGQLIASGLGPKAVKPGASVGVLNTSNMLFNSFTTVEVELNGTLPGVTHDQLNVRGTVALGGSQLVPATGPGLAAGMVMRIVNNDASDPIAGTFSGLPEGSLLDTTSGFLLQITYQGGDGNDVELLVRNPPPVVDSIVKLSSGFAEIRGHGQPNLLYTLEASTTLLPGSWVQIAADLVGADGLYELIDVEAGAFAQRFYRVLSP